MRIDGSCHAMRLNIHGVEATDQIYLGIAEIHPDCCRTGVAFFSPAYGGDQL
jgi:hypothetical protein